MTTFSDTGATPATTFFYRVRATNSANGTDSSFSNVASATTPLLLVAPAAPSGLKATAVSNSRIDLTWKDNSNNETGFKIERTVSANIGFAQIAVTGANATSFSDTGLSPSTRFFYRVRATNSAGDSNFDSADATTMR